MKWYTEYYNKDKHMGLRRVSDIFKGMAEEMTLSSDVDSEPFPFSEEKNNSHEKVQLEDISRNNSQ
jgi:hypothetical protein